MNSNTPHGLWKSFASRRLFLRRLTVVCTLVAGYVSVSAFLLLRPEKSLYGPTLFLIGPFVLGYAVGLLYPMPSHSSGPRRLLTLQGGTLVAVLFSATTIVLTGLDGLLCIGMAFPLVWGFAISGAFVSTFLPRDRFGYMTIFMSCGALLFSTGMESQAPFVSPIRPVVTSITVNAPPEEVWKHVIAFDQIPAPTEWYFRAGIAAPVKARIEGEGVGAVRYCEFTTGAFVEPITAWEENRRLAFDVVENPPPMRELSPWPHLHAAHLEGMLEASRGEFLLTSMPGGRTELRGTTYYRHGLFPDFYWRLWSDAIIHRIHLRVLEHIKHRAESVEFDLNLSQNM